jgi:hypothetical protein
MLGMNVWGRNFPANSQVCLAAPARAVGLVHSAKGDLKVEQLLGKSIIPFDELL